MWEGMDEPLPQGNWEVIGPSAIPYGEGCQVPREATRADLDRVAADVRGRGAARGRGRLRPRSSCTARTATCCRPSSPRVSNRRTDEYGGSLANRLRFPLEVFDAVRARCPPRSPMTVRISATDWCPTATTEDDAVEIARAFVEHGAAAIDVSTGQVIKDEEPAYGRSLPDPVRGPDPSRGRPAGRGQGHRGRCDLVVRRRQLDPARRPCRPVRARPHPPLRPAVDPAGGRRAGVPGCRGAVAAAVGGGPPQAPHVAHRQGPAAPLAAPGGDDRHRAPEVDAGT